MQAANDLVKRLESGSSEGKSVDDVIKSLPPELKSNMLIFTCSGSAQPANLQETLQDAHRGPDGRLMRTVDGKEVPVFPEGRITLVSPNGDVSATFTTDKNSPAYGNVEMSIFNPKSSRLEMVDIETKDNPDHSQSKAGATVERNSEKCLGCHGDPPNWRYDSYRMWHGMLPFAEDTLRKGSFESEAYLDFLRRIKSGEPGLKNITPLNSADDIQKGLDDSGFYQLKAPTTDVSFSRRYTPALNLSHQLLEKNGCRSVAALAQRPDWNKMKYAMLGALMNCNNFEKFVPDQAAVERYFKARGEGIRQGAFSLNALSEDVGRRQREATPNKLGRERACLEKFIGPDAAAREIQGAENNSVTFNGPGYGTRSFDISNQEVAKLMYAMEPYGLRAGDLTTAVDREYQTHAEFLPQLMLQKPMIDIVQDDMKIDLKARMPYLNLEECNDQADSKAMNRFACIGMMDSLKDEPGFCDRLAKLSQDAMEGKKHQAPAGTCDSPEGIDNKSQTLREKYTQLELRAKFSDIIDNHACASCHINGGGVGAPQLPLDSVENFEKAVKSSSETGSLGYKFWDRISRHFDQYGAMPRGGEPLGIDDKATVRAYLQGLTALPPHRNCSSASDSQSSAPASR